MSLFHRFLPLLAFLAATGPITGQEPTDPEDDAPNEAPDFDTRLKRFPFFKKILWTTVTTYAPFEILVQKQAVSEPDFERRVAEFYGPWMQKMAKVFEDTVAAPSKLEPVADPKPIRLIVLLTEGDFLNYSRTTHTSDGLGRGSFYDDRIRSVVTCWDISGQANLKRYPALRRFVFALLHQRSSVEGGRQPPLWLREGISSALAWHTGNDLATAFAKPMIDPNVVPSLVKITQDTSRQNVFLQPLRALATVVSVNDQWKRVQRAADTWSAELSENEAWYEGFLDQSILWVHFLRRDGAAANTRAFETYLNMAMRGGGSAADLERAFEGQDLAALDREFFKWVYERGREVLKSPPDESKLSTLFAPPPVTEAAASDALDDSDLASRLALPFEDGRVTHALALRKASRGDVEGALADLAKIVEAAPSDPSLPAIRTEIDRLEAWRSARNAWLAELAAGGGRLQLEREGKKINFKVSLFEKGVLQLELPKSKEELAVAALEPALIAGQMKSTPASSPEWVRAYAMLLCADARWEKLLKDKSPESQALRADATAVYVELKSVGIAAEHLTMLAQNSAPGDALVASSVLERLRQLMIEVPTQELVQQRLEALRGLARSAAGKLYDESRPQVEFGGKTTWVDATTLELNYDFKAQSELDDWLERPDDLMDWRKSWPPIQIPEAQREFKLADGVWAGQGPFVFRHVLPFDAPMNVELILRHGKAANEDMSHGEFVIGICDDGSGSLLAFAEAGAIYVRDLKTGKHVMAPPAHIQGIALGENVLLEVSHDGEKVRFQHFGTTEPEQSVGSRRSGGVFLIVHTNRQLAIESIRIRGKLGADAVKALRERWVAGTIAKIGLQ